MKRISVIVDKNALPQGRVFGKFNSWIPEEGRLILLNIIPFSQRTIDDRLKTDPHAANDRILVCAIENSSTEQLINLTISGHRTKLEEAGLPVIVVSNGIEELNMDVYVRIVHNDYKIITHK